MGTLGAGAGRTFAVAFNGDGGFGATYYNDGAWYPSLLLHEVTHNLGAVAESAPNSTGAGHCLQGSDVMCYDDGGPKVTQIGMRYECEGGESFGPVAEPYDCGGEDYLNPAPAPGSWLAANPAANVYDSWFMGTCAELLAGCGENRFDGADRDSDGWEDRLDACPDTPGLIVTDGCPDSDGDGVSDDQDACPTARGRYGDECPVVPSARSKTVTLRRGKSRIGKLRTSVRPGRGSYRATATASLRLPRGRYKATVCAGPAKTATARKLTGAACQTKTIKSRGRPLTLTALKTFPAATAPRYAGSKLTVSRGKHKVVRSAKLPIVKVPRLG
jgi:hypothetical protein